jgi:pimeloyl-ACP methyl ester carboxylesterase
MSWSTTAETAQGLETPLFFGADGRRKFGVLHHPAPGLDIRTPIVLCAPHFEEKLWAHRVLVDAARRACARGHVVLRFDVSGHGDSEGEFEDFALDEFDADTVEAWNLLRERAGAEPALVGLRLGATLAARAAAHLGARAALWEPILDLSAWLQEMLRANLTFQIRHFGRVVKNRAQLAADIVAGQTVTLDGYGLTPKFFREAASSAGWSETVFPGRCPDALVVAFLGRGAAPAGPLEQAAQRWSATSPCAFRVVDEEAVWTDVRRYRTQAGGLVEVTLDWIERSPVVVSS